MLLGSLSVAEIRCEAIIGILPHEREQAQPLLLGFSVSLDLEPAALSGDLSLSVDYAQLASELSSQAISGRFELLETLVLSLASFVLRRHPCVLETEISCSKPTAMPGTSGPCARLRLSREQFNAMQPLPPCTV